MKEKYQIMLIDDDEDDRMIFTMALKMVDSSISCFGMDNCIEALEYLASAVLPDLIFLDLNMPYMHGFDCLARLKQSDVTNSIPVVIYSTSGHCVDIEKAKELGAAGYLRKPSDIDDLRLKIKKVIALIESRDEDYFIE